MNDRTLRLLAVHAHPDEAYNTGGVLARLAAEGVHTVVACATRGEVGEIHGPDVDPRKARKRLGVIREQELRRSCRLLGVAEVRVLGYRDSGMAGTAANADPRNFINADPTEVQARIVRLIRRVRPQVVITYDERGGYGHPDHVAAHRATVAAFDAAGDPALFPEQGLPPWQPSKLYYTVYARGTFLRLRARLRRRGLPVPFDRPGFRFDAAAITVPDEDITTRMDVRAYLPQRGAALRAHRTQFGPADPVVAMPEDIAHEVLGSEAFQRARCRVGAPDHEDDLFAGLRCQL